MIETYREMTVVRATGMTEKIIGNVLGNILGAAGMTCFFSGLLLWAPLLLPAAAAFVLCWFCRQVMHREYEYTYVSGSLEVDVLRGSRKRKHLATLDGAKYISLKGMIFEKGNTTDPLLIDYTSRRTDRPFAEMIYPGPKGENRILLELPGEILEDLRARYPRKTEIVQAAEKEGVAGD